MAQLPDRLTQALADRYALERSADRRTLLGVRNEPDRVRIVVITPPDTTARTVAWSDRPLTQVVRNSLTLHNGRLYIPLSEPRADIWVAEVEPR